VRQSQIWFAICHSVRAALRPGNPVRPWCRLPSSMLLVREKFYCHLYLWPRRQRLVGEYTRLKKAGLQVHFLDDYIHGQLDVGYGVAEMWI
jgi:hypothetical protein